MAKIIDSAENLTRKIENEMKPIRMKSFFIGGIAGSGFGLIIATLMTLADWRINPSGLFHSQNGTNWGVVYETAISWFFPVALTGFVVAGALHYWLSNRRIRELNH